MHFSKTLLSLAASVAAVSAGSITFWTLDDVIRTVYFTPSPGFPAIEPVNVSNAENTTVNLVPGYIGNFIAVESGQPKADGMLGEVAFHGYGGKTFFDVSAIVNPNDKNNVKQMWPVGETGPMSGCEVFPCDNAYYQPDDVQTKVTDSEDIMASLGSGTTGLW